VGAPQVDEGARLVRIKGAGLLEGLARIVQPAL
jgi:hypothetical protein